jgi:D-3-phosphoglycerate dehydrogenase
MTSMNTRSETSANAAQTSHTFHKNKIKVLLLENIHPLALEAFQAEGFEVETLSVALPPAQLQEKIQGVHVLGIRSKTQVPAEVIAQASDLICIGCFCIGTNQVDLDAAQRHGIPVFNAPFGNTRSVAEMTLAEIILLSRQLGSRNLEMHSNRWRKVSTGCFEVRSKTLGIIGYGNIGSQVSTLAEGIGMRVIYFDIVSKLPLGNARGCNTLSELLRESDFITLHVPETPHTKNLINADRIQQMKRGAYLINASRGCVVEVPALAEALRSGHVGGAAIDVFPEEPEANTDQFHSELQGLPNTLLTPHIGGATEEAQSNIGTEVPATLIRFVRSGITLGAVNFPQVEHSPHASKHRMTNIHQNIPGVLRDINRLVSDLGINIEGQTLSTQTDVGYLVLDMDRPPSSALHEALEALPASIRTRVLY